MDCAEGTGDLDEDIARLRVLNADSDFFHDAIEAVPSLLGWNSAILLATAEPSGLGLSTLEG